VKATGVEGYSQTLFGEDLRNLVRLCFVVPNADRLVSRARGNELFADADIKTSDLLSMEGAHNVVKFDFLNR
jgi:hypothetical protein